MASKYAIERASKLITTNQIAEELDRHLVRLYQLCVLRDKVDAIKKLINSPHLDDFQFREQITEVLKDG